MVLREHKDPLNTSRGIMGPLENSAGVQNNRGRLKQRFDLIRKLGQGTYGKVQLGIDKETGQEVAIKTIKKSKIETEADLIRIRREIQIMSSVRHPNIIHIYEVFENREKMVLVMEYAAGGELYDYLNERKILQEDEARRIFRQIASAVYYCHKNKICHRDLKLENILLDEKSNAKIADFGLSNVFDDINLLKTFCGSPLYASPEIVKGTPYSGPEVDCWSLGVLLYTLVYGAMPFDGSNFKRLVKQISAGDYYEPKKPAEASALIRRMLTVDPLKRARVDDICSHPWINFSFDKDCLKQAEELAKQTPVRLDVLLTLAPNHNINNSQIVIPGDDNFMNEGAASHQVGNHRNDNNESNTDISEPPKKLKLQNDNKASAPEKGKPEVAPPKPKRKIQTKSKSKSTPLLDLIQDVCEEEAENDIDMDQCQSAAPAPPAHPQQHQQQQHQQQQQASAAATQGDDDEDADTLSEISEIQTLAEETPKQKSKSDKPKAKTTKDKVTEPSPSSALKPKTETPKPLETVAVPANKTDLKESTAVKEVTKKLPVAEVKVQEEKPAEPLPPTVKTVVKKKVIKPKPVTSTDEDELKKEESDKPKVSPDKTTLAQDRPKSTPQDKAQQGAEKKSETIPRKSDTPEAKPMTSGDSNKSDSSEKDGESSVKPKAKLVRTRSGSTSDASPTRIERRNSKVISQKTAELIQNLATKASTSPNGSMSTNGAKETVENRPPGIKKLVIPQFKVSDAKNKFETKPPRPIASSIMSQSKAAFEAKAQATKEAEKKPSAVIESAKIKNGEAKETISPVKPKDKEKSPSPAKKEDEVVATKLEENPKDEPVKKSTLVPNEPQKSPAVSPKVKPKVVKKHTEESKVTPPETKETEAPKPVSKPEAPKPATGKIQIPSAVQTEVKPVMIDAGKGGPKPVTMVIKGKTSPQPTAKSPIPAAAVAGSEVTSPKLNEPTNSSEAVEQPKAKLLIKLAPQNKEQAVKKISSVINKIVSSSSSDEGGKMGTKTSKDPTTPSQHKTEVSFPVSAAKSMERVIPIKFEDDTNSPASPPPGMVSGTQTPSTAQQTPSGSKTSIPRFPTLPSRMDSFKRFDSIGSMYSRQDSSDAESCSLAAPKPEPIRKSPREFLIPIKLEASGQTVTPKEDVLSEATGSEDDFRIDSRLRSGRFGKHKRYSSLLSDSSLDDEAPSVSVSAAGSRRPSTTVTAPASVASQPAHSRSRSQGDEPEAPVTTFKRYRIKRPDLDRSDSFSSAEEDDEDFFEVLTADSLFSNLLDRVRNLTKRLNREGSVGPNWPNPANEATNFGLWNPSSSLRDLMAGNPTETRGFSTSTPGNFSVSTHRSFSREPSVTSMMMNTGPGAWRRSLSRDVSGDSDASGSLNPQSRNLNGKPVSTDIFETTSVRSLPLSLSNRRSPAYLTQRSEPGDREQPGSSTSSFAGSRQSLYGGSSTASGMSGSSRPSYSRTVSNTDYGNPGISRTLPFRRSLKSYDRSSTSGIGDYSSNSFLNNNNMNSMIGTVRGLGQSLIDSPATFDPDSYLRQLRSMSRDRDRDRDSSMGRDREGSMSRMTSISEQEPASMNIGNSSNSPQPEVQSTSGELYNGWVGGSNSSCSSSILSPNGLGNSALGQPLSPSESGNTSNEEQGQDGILSVHDKMNNYQQYYQSLSQSPLRRFQLASPSQIHGTNNNLTNNNTGSGISSLSGSGMPPPIRNPKPVPGIGLARLRPNTMYETSFVDNQQQPKSHNSSNLSQIQTQSVSHPEVNVNSLTQKPISNNVVVNQSAQLANLHERPSPTLNPHLTNSRATPIHEVPINTAINAPQPQSQISTNPLEDRRPSLTSSGTTSIPKWGVSIQQYRPLSISSFPEGQRASSVSRLMSPPPRDDPVVLGKPSPPLVPSQGIQSQQQQVTTTPVPAVSPKKKEVRATSVERITRFLERKSVPREITPGPPDPIKSMDNTIGTTKEVSVDGKNPEFSPDKNVSKMSKPKFLQSLEKKWEKLTTSGKPVTSAEVNNLLDDAATANSQVSQAGKITNALENSTVSGPTSETVSREDTSLGNEDTKISESVLLRRAVSPEKKLKKFGSGTVNFMLGKFKKFEEPPAVALSGLSPSGSSGTCKIPSGKPPLGIPSRIGRRVQSVYAGAVSDSVLTLPPHPHVINPRVTQISPLTTTPSVPLANLVEPMTNGHNSLESSLPEPDADMIRTAEIAQQKRRSLRLDSRASSPAPQDPTATVPIPSSSNPTPPEIKRPLRPYSLGVFSPPSSSTISSEPQKTQSFIPRPSAGGSGTTMRSFQNPESLSPPPVTSNPETITVKSMSPPQITILDESYRNGETDDHSPISPTSISDSFDSSSVCSDKNDSKNLSVLDEEESVSDRILRKSFYSRFNSIDRARRCSSLSSAAAARRNLGPLTTPKNAYSKSSGSASSGSVGVGHANSLNTRAQSVERSLAPTKPHKDSLKPRRAYSPGPGTSTTSSEFLTNNNKESIINGSGNLNGRPKSPSPHNSLVINKYNPNPLFKELITDDFKSNVEQKTEYSRRVTSKLSKLLREIESDLNTCTLSKRDDDDEDNCINNPNGIGIGLRTLTNNHNCNHNHDNNNHRKTNDILNRRNHIFSREVSVQPDEVSGRRSRLSPEPKDDDCNDSMNER